MPEPFDAYHKWLAIPPEDQPPNAYRLLGVKLFESDLDVISHAADARMAQVRTFQSGAHAALSQTLLNQLASVRGAAHSGAKGGLRSKTGAAQTGSAVRIAKAAPLVAQAAPIVATPQPAVISQTAVEDDAVSFVGEEAYSSARRKPKKSGLSPPALIGGAIATLLAAGVAVWAITRGENPSGGHQAVASAPLAAPDPAKTPTVHQNNANESAADETAANESADDQPVSKAPAAKSPVVKSPVARPTRPVAKPPADASPDDDEPPPIKTPLKPSGKPPQRVKSKPGGFDVIDSALAAEGDGAGAASELDDPAMAADKSRGPGRSKPSSDDDPDAAGESTKPAAAPRAPVPDAAARKEALTLLMDVYKDEYAKAKKPADKAELANRLLEQVDASPDSQAYALLIEAQRLGQAAGEPGLVGRSIHTLAQRFEVNEPETLAEAFEKFSDKTLTKPAWTELVEAALPCIDTAVSQEQFALAKRLLLVAASGAKKSGQPATTRQLAQRGADLAEATKLFDSAQAARKKLATDPDDAESHTALGKYLCFALDNWPEGAPHLAQGADAALKQLGVQEAANPNTPADQVKLADGWWDLAGTAAGPVKNLYFRRAAWWYGAAQGDVTGLGKAKVEKRLQMLAEKLPSLEGSPAGDKPSASGGRSKKAFANREAGAAKDLAPSSAPTPAPHSAVPQSRVARAQRQVGRRRQSTSRFDE